MKIEKYIFALFLGILVFSCDTENNMGIPVISEFKILGYGLIGPGTVGLIERDTFVEEESITIRFTVTDEDLDIKQAVLIQKSNTIVIDPLFIDMPRQQEKSQEYIATVRAELAGNWTIEVYVIDDKGNRSNTITRNIFVDALPTFSVTYDLNGGSGTVPVDNNRYRANEIIIAASSDGFYREGGYVFDAWRVTKLINNWTFTKNAGTQFTINELGGGTPSDILLDAIWQPSIHNISYSRIGNNYTIFWEEPDVTNFICVDYFVSYEDNNSVNNSISSGRCMKGDMSFAFSLTPEVQNNAKRIRINFENYLRYPGPSADHYRTRKSFWIELE